MEIPISEKTGFFIIETGPRGYFNIKMQSYSYEDSDSEDFDCLTTVSSL